MTHARLQIELVNARAGEARLALNRMVHHANCVNAFDERASRLKDIAGCAPECMRVAQWKRIHFLEKWLTRLLELPH